MQLRLSHHPVIRFCSVHATEAIDREWGVLKLIYQQSDRYKTFKRDSRLVHQFDNETRGLTTWNSTIAQQGVDWNQPTDNLTNEELLCAFESLINHCCANKISLSVTDFDEFIDNFITRLPHFSLNETINALQVFTRIDLNKNLIKERNYIELFQAFDQACTIQLTDLLPDQLLFISSIWLEIPSSKRTYTAQLLSRLFNRYMKTMSAPEIGQSLLYINCMSQQIEDIRQFENIFEDVIDQMTLTEFSTVMWTFNRLDTKFEKQELRAKYFDYLEKQDLSKLHQVQLAKILIVTTLFKIKCANRIYGNLFYFSLIDYIQNDSTKCSTVRSMDENCDKSANIHRKKIVKNLHINRKCWNTNSEI